MQPLKILQTNLLKDFDKKVKAPVKNCLLKAYQYAKRYNLSQKGLLKCHEMLAATFSNITKKQKGRYRLTKVGIRGWQGLVYLSCRAGKRAVRNGQAICRH